MAKKPLNVYPYIGKEINLSTENKMCIRLKFKPSIRLDYFPSSRINSSRDYSTAFDVPKGRDSQN